MARKEEEKKKESNRTNVMKVRVEFFFLQLIRIIYFMFSFEELSPILIVVYICIVLLIQFIHTMSKLF